MEKNESLITVVSVCYNQMPYILPSFVFQFLSQSDQRFKLQIWNDGPDTAAKEFMEPICKEHPHITYHESEKREHFPGAKQPCCDLLLKEELRGNGWGHFNRARGLELVDTEWVWFQNCDNQVVPRAVEVLNNCAVDPNISILWWSIAHNYMNYRSFQQDFANCCIDMSQFAVRTSVAKEVGFNHRCFIADGLFVEDIKRLKPGLQIAKLEGMILGVHN